jgi:hypothetical protein
MVFIVVADAYRNGSDDLLLKTMNAIFVKRTSFVRKTSNKCTNGSTLH